MEGPADPGACDAKAGATKWLLDVGNIRPNRKQRNKEAVAEVGQDHQDEIEDEMGDDQEVGDQLEETDEFDKFGVVELGSEKQVETDEGDREGVGLIINADDDIAAGDEVITIVE